MTTNSASDEMLGDESSDSDSDSGPMASLLSVEVAFVTDQGVSNLRTTKSVQADLSVSL